MTLSSQGPGHHHVRSARPGTTPGGLSANPAELRTLTERETEVSACMGDGLSKAQIATRLYLTEATVKALRFTLRRSHSVQRLM